MWLVREGEGPRKGAKLECRERPDHVAGPTELSPPQTRAVPRLLPERPSSGLAAGRGGGWKWECKDYVDCLPLGYTLMPVTHGADLRKAWCLQGR